ncbi:Protein ROS1 [Platanthera guangdongensis]|uniref:Protein ROS1 n=1 Tax=Platanthera guangdongensis TaxID=2320717 RepID=A0ABR2M6C6_9ASPA
MGGKAPPTCTPLDGNQFYESTTSGEPHLLPARGFAPPTEKGKHVLAPNLSNKRSSCCDILPVVSIPNRDSSSAPPTPATPEKFNKSAQDKQPSSKVTELVEEWGSGENQMANEVSSYQPEMKKLKSDRDIREETADRLIRIENSSTDRETKAIDLLGTPNKRPQRKKHRPKVLKEGKPSRTPKLATSPSDMDGTSCKRKYVWRNKDVTHSSEKENTSCRRKYTRRSKDVAHSSNTNVFKEIIETESKGKAKSPRRCLNFDLEDPKTMEEFSAAMLVFKNVLGDRGRDVCNESAATSSSLAKASDSNWVQDHVAVKPSTYQSQNECLQQIPVPYAEVNKNICALDEQIPSLKSSVKHFKALARESACSDSTPKSSSEISQSNLNPIGIPDSPPKSMKMCHLSTDEASESAQNGSAHSYNLDSPPKGMKMCHLSTDEAREPTQKRIAHPYNLRACSSKSHAAARQNSSLTGFLKAIRREKWGHNEANLKFSPSWEMKQLANNLLEFKFVDAQRFIAQEKARILECILAFHEAEKYDIKNANLDSGLASLGNITSWGRKSTPTKQFKQKSKGIIQPSTPENNICGHQTHPEKPKDIDKSFQQAQSHLLYFMFASTEHTCVEVRKEAHSNDISPPQKNANIGVLTTRNLNWKILYPETISADCQSTSYFNVPTYSSFSSGPLAYVNLVDCIIENLRHLYISRHHEVASSHPQNAVVRYARHGFMMVPYDRSFELAKRRRRPRAKVLLDPESNRVWKLLMGKDCGEGGEPPDVDKEKWWDEERRVFQGRVDSFIARMHLIQGDRRYSQWKGSVVDSVVGVFLTQNVSDHLSSSAFMSLAANFPLSSRGKFNVPETERVNTSMESHNRSLFDNGLFFKSSVEVSASQNGEGKETSDCSEILGSTTRSSIIYYSRQKGKGKGPDSQKREGILCQESTFSGSVGRSGINLGEIKDIRLLDSHNSIVSSQNSNGFYAKLNFEAGDLSGGSMDNALGSSSFTELLHMAERTGLKEFCNNIHMPDRVGPNLKAEIFPKTSPETANSAINTRKIEKSTYDWENLRKEVCCSKPAEERSSTTMDSLDWEAVRTADVSKVAEAIRTRGMNNVLAERIQDFLNRLVREHGGIDLEWLRDVSPDKVKDYLLSIRGLGLKSAECVRLLTLRQLAFPVDTNVGRICVRLGWVPLQPLPESLQLHLLELYPVLATIQKYLWPRLCKLDQCTLYELHYQMITFGKVFCTKSKPNCNSCPMRGECRHFASAFASARLSLTAPEDKSLLSLTSPIASDESADVFLNPGPFPQIEESLYSQEPAFQNNGEPIIEEPASPEQECQESLKSAIEDAFYEEPEEIPTIKLNLTEFTQYLRNYMKENMELHGGSLSKALVTLTPEATSIPMPKLKNVSRLRTEHQAYEIPDTHPLLEGLDPREPDDPSPYLLAIWTPGETAQSTEPPKADCNFQGVGQPCERSTCFGCNSMREAESHKIRGTLLIPCRTAMRGSFPLNGTYFQVNEVFADHHSSREPIYVLRDWIWNLPRRTVYFGTSIPTIFKGFVCVRGFDRVTRAPKPLYARLHFPASKATKNRNVE